MKLGAEPKKVAIMAGLMVVAGYLMYTNVFSASPVSGPPPEARKKGASPAAGSSAPAARTGVVATAQQAIPGEPARTAPPSRRRGRETTQEWNPNLKPRKPEERLDPVKVDPTLRLDLLAKLQSVVYSGRGERSLFDFSQAPPPKITQPDVKITPKKGGKGAAEVPQITDSKPPEMKPGEVPKPAAPPIPFKFYGFIAAKDGKRGFFLGNDEIFTVSEGQMIQRRYKVVRIGLTSAVLEDTNFAGHQQTLALEEPPAGS